METNFKLLDIVILAIIIGFFRYSIPAAAVAVLAAYLIGRYHDQVW